MSVSQQRGADGPRRVKGSYARFKESLKNLVIRVLAEGEMHGYEIMKRIEEITGGRWRPAPGALYPLLDQLRAEGLIEVGRVDDRGVRGGRKIVYRLTDRGWRYLAEVLEENAEYKVWILEYYVLQGALQLRKRGMEEEARRICERLSESLSRITGMLGSC